MDTRTFQTKDGPEADRRPLWVLHTTLGTLVIARQSLDNGLFLGAHLTHGELLVCCSQSSYDGIMGHEQARQGNRDNNS